MRLPSLRLDVDRDAEVDRAVVDAVRLAVDLGEVVGHDRHLLGGRARDRVGDQVREGDLVAGVLELLAPRVERRDGDRAERGRGRDRPRLVHVAREHRRRALDQRGVLRGGGAAGAFPFVPRTSAFMIRPPGPLPWIRSGRCPRPRRRGAPQGRPDAVGQDLLGCSSGSAGRRGLGARRGGRRGGPRRCALRFMRADDLADGHGVARLGEDLLDHARGGGGDLGVDLVGRDLDDRLVGLDRRRRAAWPTRGSRLRTPTRPSPAWRCRLLRRRALLGRGLLGPGAAGAAPFVAISASTAPTWTVSPSAAWILTTVPLAGAGTSASTLSVEISTSVSSSGPGRLPACATPGRCPRRPSRPSPA